ncbi:MAG: YhgE/Pip domain-containing protein [Clostridium sp.]|uniref:YhgE/Pip domain-containing protein n=1 Tax=Clostridium sp. TaxID=1506 RepID=UPI002FC94C1D
MRNIFKVYTRDMKNISKNVIAIIVILGLAILPSLYAWFNIKSSWDPYGNLSKVSVAIVNDDIGGSLNNKKINIGNQVVDNLKANKTLDFHFVSDSEASNGLEMGRYYASIKIDKNFTKDIMSILKENPVKPRLIYTVNEKRNAVAPKITEKSASVIKDEITKSFIAEVTTTAIKGLNELDIKIEEQLPLIAKFEKILFDLEGQTGNIKSSVKNLYNGSVDADKLLGDLNNQMPRINSIVNESSSIIDNSIKFVNTAADDIISSSEVIKADLIHIKNTADNMNSILSPEDVNLASKVILERLSIIKGSEKNALIIINKSIDYIDSINKNGHLDKIRVELVSLRTNVEKSITMITELEGKINSGAEITEGTINNIKSALLRVSSKSSEIITGLNGKYKDDFNKAVGEISHTLNEASIVLNDAKGNMPKIKSLVEETHKGVKDGSLVLKDVNSNMDDAVSLIKSTADKVRTLNSDEKFQELFKLLKSDAKKESDFMSSPVQIVDKRIYPVPNYGSAMSPFFTTLALWVGGLILVSILSTNAVADNIGQTSRYLGRLLTFITIGIMQALIVTLGDVFILGTYNSSPLLFILSGVLISIVFVTIIYSLTYILGAVGKALSVILLVLQISSSGGTFPVEVTPTFFNNINPFLPFTYAIGLMREAVAGYIPSAVMQDVIVLLIFFSVSLVLGVYMSTKDRSLGELFKNKFKESGLAED